MKRVIKRVIPVILVMVLCLNISGPAFAATEGEDSTNMLIEKHELTAEQCKVVYDEYVACYGDYTDITMALADTLSMNGFYTYSVAVSIASALGAINYTTAMDAAYKGWQSGRGATLYIYDNAVPVVIAN